MRARSKTTETGETISSTYNDNEIADTASSLSAKLTPTPKKRQLTLERWLTPESKKSKIENGRKIPTEREELLSSTKDENCQTIAAAKRASDHFEGYTKISCTSHYSRQSGHSTITTTQHQNNNNNQNNITTFEYPMSARNRYGIGTVISNMHVLAGKSSHQYLGTRAAVSTTAAAVKNEVDEEEDFSNGAIADNAYSPNTDPFPQNYFEHDYTHGNTSATSKNVFRAEKCDVADATKKKGEDIIMNSIQDDDKENVYASSQRDRDRHHHTTKRMR